MFYCFYRAFIEHQNIDECGKIELLRINIMVAMKRTITYNGDKIEYELTVKAVKNINLRVKRDGSVQVSASRRTPVSQVDAFVIEQAPFITRARLGYAKAAENRPEPLQYVTGEEMTILGTPVQIQLEPLQGRKRQYAVYDGKETLYLYVKPEASRDDKQKLLNTFWKHLGSRVFSHWSQVVYERFHQRDIDVPVPIIKQQIMKSRWGSCTLSKRIIKMNQRLLEAPQSYIEYIMVHEYCHFIHLDHSPNFHNLVESFLPDWKQRKHDLNEYFRYK